MPCLFFPVPCKASRSSKRLNVKFVETPTREKATFWEMCLICRGQVGNRSLLWSCLTIRPCVFYTKPKPTIPYFYPLTQEVIAKQQYNFKVCCRSRQEKQTFIHYKNPISSCLLFIQDSGGAAAHGEIMQKVPQISRKQHPAKNDSLLRLPQAHDCTTRRRPQSGPRGLDAHLGGGGVTEGLFLELFAHIPVWRVEWRTEATDGLIARRQGFLFF